MKLATLLDRSGLPDTARFRDAHGDDLWTVGELRRHAATAFMVPGVPAPSTPDMLLEFYGRKVRGVRAIAGIWIDGGVDLGPLLVEVTT